VPVPQGKDAAAVTKLASAAAKAVATDRKALKAILTLALPADVINSLGMEALIDALVASTKVDEGEAAAAKPTAQVKVTQKIPGVKPADLDTAQLSEGEWDWGLGAPRDKGPAEKGQLLADCALLNSPLPPPTAPITPNASQACRRRSTASCPTA
jgi:hypothetical protein